MKLDKEALIKHRFWIFLGLEIPLVLIATLVLLLGVRAGIEKRKKEVDGKIKAVTSVKDVRNQNWVDELEKMEKGVNAKLTALWAEGWNVQSGLVTWPKSLESRFHTGLFAVKIKVNKEKVELNPVQDNEKDYLFRGRIKSISNEPLNPLEVQGPISEGKDKEGKDKIKMVTKKFLLTPKLKLEGAPELTQTLGAFNDLQGLQKQNKDLTVEVTFIAGKYFGDDFISQEKNTYQRDYRDQLRDLYGLLLNARDYDKLLRGSKDKMEPLIQMESTPEDRWLIKNGQLEPPLMVRWQREWVLEKLADAEAIWNAQEDLWVQRELIRVAKDANAFVGKMEPNKELTAAEKKTFDLLSAKEAARKELTPAEKQQLAKLRNKMDNGEYGPEEKRVFTFTSPLWKIQIMRDDKKVKARLINPLKLAQQLDLSFMVQVSEPRAGERPVLAELRFPAEEGKEVLKENEAKDIEVDLSTFNPKGIYGIEQVLSLVTAPVKRIQDMKLGAHSHRTYPKGLRYREGSEAAKAEKDKPAEKKDDNNPMSNMGTGKGSGKGGPMTPGAGHGGDGGEKKEDPNKRYSESTVQFRKMPVAMVLVVDQDSVHYVLAAFEKSKLRFQVTQVLMTRYAEPLKERKKKPKKPAEKKKEGGKDEPMTDLPPMPMGPKQMGGGSMMGPRPMGGGSMMGGPAGGKGRYGGAGSPMPSAGAGSERYRPGYTPPGGHFGREDASGSIIAGQRPEAQSTGGSASAGEERPVVELVVYGYATIYERFPKKPDAAKADEGNPQTGPPK
jgi:hypothetical protein